MDCWIKIIQIVLPHEGHSANSFHGISSFVSFCLGPSIKDVRRDGGGVKCGQGVGVKDLAEVRKLVLFFIVSACFAGTLYG